MHFSYATYYIFYDIDLFLWQIQEDCTIITSIISTNLSRTPHLAMGLKLWACWKNPEQKMAIKLKKKKKYIYIYAAAKLLQSCSTLCNPTDSSPPGSPVPGILQARGLEWGAVSFSNAWKGKVKVKSLSHAPDS